MMDNIEGFDNPINAVSVKLGEKSEAVQLPLTAQTMEERKAQQHNNTKVSLIVSNVMQ